MSLQFKRLKIFTVSLLLILMIACQANHSTLSTVSNETLSISNSVLATMGSVKLTQPYFNEIIKSLTNQQREQLKSTPKALEKLAHDEIIKLYILHLSEKTGWSIHPEVRKQANFAANQAIIASYIGDKSKLASNFPTVEQIENAYQKNKEHLYQPDLIHLAQIFLINSETDQLSIQQQIKSIRQKLRKDPRKFKELAQQYSQHNSSNQEGDLGWIRQDQLIPGFSTITEKMQPGDISPIITTQLGVHILQLIERKKGEIYTLEQASPLIAEQLIQQAIQIKEKQYLQNLLIQNPVTIKQDVLNKAIKQLNQKDSYFDKQKLDNLY